MYAYVNLTRFQPRLSFSSLPSFQADKPKSAAAAPRPEGQVAQRHRRILGGRGLWLRLGGVQGVGGQVHAALPLAASSADTAASLEIKRWDIIVNGPVVSLMALIPCLNRSTVTATDKSVFSSNLTTNCHANFQLAHHCRFRCPVRLLLHHRRRRRRQQRPGADSGRPSAFA